MHGAVIHFSWNVLEVSTAQLIALSKISSLLHTCIRVGITKSQYYTVSSEHHYELVCYLAATEIFWCSFRGAKGSHWVWLEPQATAKERDRAGGLQCYERSETCRDSGDRDELLFLCGQD